MNEYQETETEHVEVGELKHYKNTITTFVTKYEQYLGFLALFTGFTVDSLTLTRIDLLLDNLILFTYLFIAGASILVLNISDKPFLNRWLPYLMQYAFGGLFSGYVIFYSRSASLLASWPFLLILFFILIGNEFFRKKYQRLAFQLSIYFIAVFSFFIFFIPVAVKQMNNFIFIISGLVSLFVMWVFFKLLTITPVERRKNPIFAKLAVIIIFLGINALYFANLIPPIPLSLKEFGIYHNVERINTEEYKVSYEKQPWYEFYKDEHIKWQSGKRIYSFAAVFAPTKIKGTIVHEWSFFNELNEVWEIRDKINYPINGGRDGGYRGFTFKTQFEPGLWRVRVMNERDQILGVKKFILERDDTPLELTTEIK